MSEEKIDVLHEKLWLYKTQKDRVKLDVEIESKLRKTFPTLSQDVRLLNEVLDDVQRLQDEDSSVDNPLKTRFESLPPARRRKTG